MSFTDLHNEISNDFNNFSRSGSAWMAQIDAMDVALDEIEEGEIPRVMRPLSREYTDIDGVVHQDFLGEDGLTEVIDQEALERTGEFRVKVADAGLVPDESTGQPVWQKAEWITTDYTDLSDGPYFCTTGRNPVVMSQADQNDLAIREELVAPEKKYYPATSPLTSAYKRAHRAKLQYVFSQWEKGIPVSEIRVTKDPQELREKEMIEWIKANANNEKKLRAAWSRMWKNYFACEVPGVEYLKKERMDRVRATFASFGIISIQDREENDLEVILDFIRDNKGNEKKLRKGWSRFWKRYFDAKAIGDRYLPYSDVQKVIHAFQDVGITRK